jgi:hypothetical protein
MDRIKSKKGKVILIAILLAVGIAASIGYVMYRSKQLKAIEEEEKGTPMPRMAKVIISRAIGTRISQPLFIEYNRAKQQVILTDEEGNQMSFSLKELKSAKPIFIRWERGEPVLTTTLTEKEIRRYYEIKIESKYTKEEKERAKQIALSDPRIKEIIEGKHYRIRLIEGTYDLEGGKAVKTNILVVGITVSKAKRTDLCRAKVDLEKEKVTWINFSSLGVKKGTSVIAIER